MYSPTLLCEVRKPISIVFPMLPVKVFDFHVIESRWIDTAEIDTDAIGIRPRYIERLYTTIFTEVVLGNTRVESIKRQLIPVRPQIKSLARNDKMQVTDSITDRTIAPAQNNIRS